MSTIEEPRIILPEDLGETLQHIAEGVDPRVIDQHLGVPRKEAFGKMHELREFFQAKTLAQAVHNAIGQRVLRVEKREPQTRVSPIEIEIIGWFALGHNNRDTSVEYGRSKESFAKNHIPPLFKKLKTPTRESAVVRGHQFSLITDELLQGLQERSKVLK